MENYLQEAVFPKSVTYPLFDKKITTDNQNEMLSREYSYEDESR